MSIEQKVVPVLRIFDMDKTREFYVDWLGFTIDWEHRFGENFPVYMQVSHDDFILHLSEHHGDGSPGIKVIINVQDIDNFHQRISAKNYRYYKPGIQVMEWNARIMQLIDPFGNTLVFSEDLEK